MSDYQAYHSGIKDEFSEYDPKYDNIRELECEYCGWQGMDDELVWSEVLQTDLCPWCSGSDLKEI